MTFDKDSFVCTIIVGMQRCEHKLVQASQLAQKISTRSTRERVGCEALPPQGGFQPQAPLPYTFTRCELSESLLLS
eukprot:1191750-Prorocentrum_minimum.AAC.3